MNTSLPRLTSLHVADVMNRHAVCVEACYTLAEAAAVMLPHMMSGAPVVDEYGRCIGMLSAVDFMRREQVHEERCGSALSGNEHLLAPAVRDEPRCIAHAGACTVRDHMSPAVQGVSASSTLLEAARMMCVAHLHRLPVLDAGGHPLGMVSSLDVVAALVNAMDEQRTEERRRDEQAHVGTVRSGAAGSGAVGDRGRGPVGRPSAATQ